MAASWTRHTKKKLRLLVNFRFNFRSLYYFVKSYKTNRSMGLLMLGSSRKIQTRPWIIMYLFLKITINVKLFQKIFFSNITIWKWNFFTSLIKYARPLKSQFYIWIIENAITDKKGISFSSIYLTTSLEHLELDTIQDFLC